MSRSTVGIGCVVLAAIASTVGTQGAVAADKKEVYVSPQAERKPLFTGAVPGMDGHELTIEQFTFPPGWVGDKHYHTGPVFVYILEGAFSVTEHGKKDQTFNAGALYREPIGTPMQARNLSSSEPLKVLLMQVGRKGEPLMMKSE